MIRILEFFNKRRRGTGRLLVMLVCGLLLHPVFGETNKVSGVEDAESEGRVYMRNPFWPVGYQPEVKGLGGSEAAQETERKDALLNKMGSNWELAMKQVEIQGVSSRGGGDFFAVINGEIKAVGDTVGVKLGAMIYTWSVDRITPPGTVELRRLTVQ
jgi:hypothetical protein